MKKRQFISITVLVISILFAAITPVYAVSETAGLFLMISPSAQANGMGQTYGNIVSTDPMASIMNPASAGMFAQNNTLGINFYINKVDWLPVYKSDIFYNPSCINLGFNLKQMTKLPVSIGLAYNRIKLDLGEQLVVDENSPTPIGYLNAREKSQGITFSIAVDYFFQFSFGYTQKSIDSYLMPVISHEKINLDPTTADAHDIGFIVKAPVLKLLLLQKPINNAFPNLRPYFNTGYYYSKNNIGSEISYLDSAMPDPLPRKVSVGINLDLGLKYTRAQETFNLIALKWAREADDLLVKRDYHGKYQYLSGLNDIDFTKNIIYGKGSNDIITKTGVECNIGDLFFLRKGKYEDEEGKVFVNTWGLGINFSQSIIRLSGKNQKNSSLIYLLKRLDIVGNYARYNARNTYSEYSSVYAHSLDDTNFWGLTMRLKKLSQ